MKDYGKLLEKATLAYRNCASNAERRRLESIFPELKVADDEDDGIRRDLIEFVRQYGDNYYGQFSKASAISWLEKQGEKSVNKMQVSDELYEHIRNTCACIDDALIIENLADKNDYLSMAKHSAQSAFDMIEKQAESSKPGTGNQPHEGDPDNPYDMSFEDAQQYASRRGIDIPINDGDVFADERHITQTIGNILRWADEHPKGEPKFRVGDWIIGDDSSINKDYDICRITNVENGIYTVESIYGHKGCNTFEMFEKNYRLWSIVYAKNGDILSYVTDEGDLWIMSYNSLYEPYRGHVHYNALLANDELSGKGTCFICIDNLKPATKEQREQLENALEGEVGFMTVDKKSKNP